MEMEINYNPVSHPSYVGKYFMYLGLEMFADWNINFVNTGRSVQFTSSAVKPHGDFAFKQFHFQRGPTYYYDQDAVHKIHGYSYATKIHFVHAKRSALLLSYVSNNAPCSEKKCCAVIKYH